MAKYCMSVFRLPPLNWLRAFEAAARHLSFTDAAAELNLTQAAISKQIKMLELRLGQPLFVRGPRSLTLTKAAQAFLPKVRDAFERLSAGAQEVFGAAPDRQLKLRVGVSFASLWLAPRLPRFLAVHPDISLRLISSVWNEPLDPDRFDLDIQYGTGNWPGYDAQRLMDETLFPVCAPALAAGLKQASDLRKHPLIHVLGWQDGWEIWLRANQVSGIDAAIGIQTDNSLLAYELAAHGGGIALARSSIAQGMIAANCLVVPFEAAIPVREAFYLLRRADGVPNNAIERFSKWILQECGQ